MDTIILLRSPKPDEIDFVHQADQAFTTDLAFTEEAQRKVHFVKTESEKYYFNQAFELIQQFAHYIYEGKKVAEHLTVDGHFLYFYTRFILINRFTPALKENFYLKEILKRLPPQALSGNISVLHTSPYTPHFESELNLKFFGHETVRAGKLDKRSFFLLFAARALVGIFKSPPRKKVKHLFLFPQVEPQPLLDRETLKMKEGNPITDYYLKDFLAEPGNYILEERYPLNEGRYNLSFQNIFGKYGNRSLAFEPYLIGAMLKLKRSDKLKELAKKEKILFNLVRKDENPAIRLLNHIVKDLRSLRKLGLLRLCAANRIFEKYQPSVAGCIDEYSVKSKSVMDAAINSGIKTYAIQHGIIHKHHMGYSYLPQDATYNKFTHQLFVYGDEIKELLLDQYHQVKNIRVSGQLRTDIIPALKKNHHQINIEGLDDSKPIILYASQPVFSVGGSEVRDAINRDFLRLSKEFPSCQFVLKPHPRETNWDYFTDLAKGVGAADFLITNADLYLLLSKCSMLLTHSSSVGPEAVNFDKPLVVQDYLDIDIVNYIKDGIGFKATNYQELKSVIQQILDGRLKFSKEAYQKYRKRFSGPLDGRTSQRILDMTKG